MPPPCTDRARITVYSVIIFTIFLSVLFVRYCVNVSAVAGVDAETEGSSVDEDRIVSQWREISANEKHQLHEQVDEILRPLGLQTRLLVVERANSIALYFFSMTLLAVNNLRDLWRTGQLRDIVQSLFTFLEGTTGSVRVKRLTWPVSDYERCLQIFSSFQGKPQRLNITPK